MGSTAGRASRLPSIPWSTFKLEVYSGTKVGQDPAANLRSEDLPDFVLFLEQSRSFCIVVHGLGDSGLESRFGTTVFGADVVDKDRILSEVAVIIAGEPPELGNRSLPLRNRDRRQVFFVFIKR